LFNVGSERVARIDRLLQYKRLTNTDNMLEQQYPALWQRLSVKEKSLLTLLFSAMPSQVPKEQLLTACGTEHQSLLYTSLSRLKRKVAPYGLTIKAQYGQGVGLKKEEKFSD
jgi:hypothetical protein